MQEKIYNIFKLLRIWQWVKNLVVFTLPVGAGVINPEIIYKVGVSFFGICLISSSIYVLNDLSDKAVDKQHPLKKLRPIASGKIKESDAKVIFFFLFFFGSLILFYLSLKCFLAGIIYFFFGVLYTIKLKYIRYLDILTISLLFICRVFIGSTAIDIIYSNYLISFIFFSSAVLAISKRISIMLNDDIDIQSKYKNFLIEQYSVDILNRLMKISSITAVIVYIFWIVSKYNSELFGVNNIYLVVSSIFLLQVLQSIQRLTNSSGLEDFVVSMYRNKRELIVIIIALTSLLLGIYL